MTPALRLEFLVEEPSMESFLYELVPPILPNVDFDVHVFRGKLDLLKNLKNRLQGYRYWLPDD